VLGAGSSFFEKFGRPKPFFAILNILSVALLWLGWIQRKRRDFFNRTASSAGGLPGIRRRCGKGGLPGCGDGRFPWEEI
jgi:hypothetical protein